MQTSLMQKFDVIILGGGLVGLTAANLYANSGFSVAVIEKQPMPTARDDSAFDIRCSAISRKSQAIFQDLTVWDEISAARISPYSKMVVWDALGFGEITFDAREVSEPNLGHIIENSVMLKALQKKCQQNSEITVLSGLHPVAIEFHPDHVNLQLSDALNLQAKLVVGADGKHSWLRKNLQIETIEQNYQQVALVTTVQTEFPHQETAWQRFLPDGPLAFLPLNEPRACSIVWTTTPEQGKALMAFPTEMFNQELAHHFDYRLGKILTCSQKECFPLSRLQAKEYIKERAVLMGDALHVIHPLAGQGVNLGLYDALELSNILTNAKQKSEDIGCYSILRKFERARKGQVTATLFAMDFFKKLFGSTQSWVAGFRSIGLNGIDKFPWLKQKIIRQAMGL